MLTKAMLTKAVFELGSYNFSYHLRVSICSHCKDNSWSVMSVFFLWRKKPHGNLPSLFRSWFQCHKTFFSSSMTIRTNEQECSSLPSLLPGLFCNKSPRLQVCGRLHCPYLKEGFWPYPQILDQAKHTCRNKTENTVFRKVSDEEKCYKKLTPVIVNVTNNLFVKWLQPSLYAGRAGAFRSFLIQ